MAESSPSSYTGTLVLVLGAVFFFLGWKKANTSLIDALGPTEKIQILENLYRRRKLNRGPKVVAIGGGTGLSTNAKRIKTYYK